MSKKVIIDVADNFRGKLSNNDILIYSGSCFYITTKQSLFMEEQKEREEFVDKMNNEIETLRKEKEEMIKEINDLKKEYQNFLIKYKETNSKMIDMIEEIMKK